MLENSYEIYLKSMEWLREMGSGEPGILNLELRLEYLDTSSVRSVVDMVKILNGFKEKGFNITITWYYEKDEEDLYEIGESLQHISKAEFHLVENKIEAL